MRKKLFWSVFIIATFWLLIQASSANASCPSGVCEIEINATTGVITWRDAPPSVNVSAPVLPEPIVPTHTINVQTSTQSWGSSGTTEQIAQAVQTLTPQPMSADPCLNGGCNKVEINATTGVTTILPLNEADLKQRAKDQITKSQAQAELAKTAHQALPNITAWQPSNPSNSQPLPATLLDETLSPDWWAGWLESFNLFFQDWFWWWSL